MFNICKFEFKVNLLSVLMWSFFIFFFSLIYISMYPIISNSLTDFEEILASYPEAALQALGFNIGVMTSFPGFYTFVATFINIVAFSFATSLTLKVILKEYKNKSIEFIYTKPIKRSSVLLQKTLAIFMLINLLFLITIHIIYAYSLLFTDVNYLEFLKLNVPMYLLMVYAMVISLFISTLLNKIRSYGGIGFLIAIGFYFIYIISSINDSEMLGYISVYGIFNYLDILTKGLDVTVILVSSCFFILLFIVTLVINNRKDVL